MNKLLQRLHKHQDQRQAGLTLVELLIAMSVSSVIVIAATNLVIQSMEWRANAEELRRKRTEWNLARRFIEEEVTSSTRVITEADDIEIPEECGLKNDEKFKFTHAIMFPLERPMRVKDDTSLREDFPMLPMAIYGVKDIDNGSVISGNALVRCGPRITHGGSYGGFYEAELCADGQSTNCHEVILDNLGSNDNCQDGFCVNATACKSSELNRRGLRFYLLANGLSTNSRSPYGQCLGTQSRVAPVHYFPDTSNVCSGQGNFKRGNLFYISKDPSQPDDFYGPEGDRTRRVPEDSEPDHEFVMCGINWFDVIEGSDQNDILAACDITTKCDKAVEINGNGGDDRLLGGDSNDTIEGGAGDDVLIGGKGNDTLIGGSGKNSYLVGEGDDTVEGSDGVDIIFIPKSKSDFGELGGCSKSNCVVTDSSESGFTATITNGDVLIFLDGRKRLE